MRERVFRVLAGAFLLAEGLAVYLWVRDGFQPRSWDMLAALAGMVLITPPAAAYVLRGGEAANRLLGRMLRIVAIHERFADRLAERYVEMPPEDPDARPARELPGEAPGGRPRP